MLKVKFKSDITVSAIQFLDNTDRIVEIHDFIGIHDDLTVKYDAPGEPKLALDSGFASVGDYIVKTERNPDMNDPLRTRSFSVMPKWMFETLYDPIEE